MAAKTLASRLRRIMRTMQWSQTELARAAGASRQTVSRWLQDGHIKIDAAFAFRLQDESGFCARWILLGEGPVHITDPDGASLPDVLRAEMVRHAQTVARILREATKT